MKYIVFFVGALLMPSFLLAHEAEEHILISPATMSYEAGVEIPVEVRIHAPEAITAFRIHLTYDPAMLEVSEIKPNTETFPYWWKQEATNGVITLEASLPKPGFAGESLVAGVVVTAKEAGTKLLEVDEDASLLLNPQDENILKSQAESAQPIDYTTLDSGISDFWGVGGGVLFGFLIIAASGVALGVLLFLRSRKK